MAQPAEGADSFLQQVLGAAEEGIAVLTRDGEVVLANAAARRLLCLPAASACLPAAGTAFLAREGDELPGEALPWIRAASDGEPQRGVGLRLRSTDGVTGLLADAVPLTAEDGEILGVAVTVRPAPSRTAPGEPLAAESLLDQMPVGVVMTDAEGRLLYSNERLEHIWRVPARNGDLRAQVEQLPAFHDDGTPYPPEERPLARALRGETVTDEEMTIRLGDGTLGVVLASSAPLMDAEGRPLGAIGAVVDVTERAIAERLSAAMGEINAAMDSCLEAEEAMSRVLGIAGAAVGAAGAVLLKRRVNDWRVAYVHGYPASTIGEILSPQDAPLATQVAETGSPVAHSAPEGVLGAEWVERFGVRSALAVRTDVAGEGSAVLALTFDHPVTFSDSHIAFVQRLTRAVSLALGNTALVESLRRELAHTKLLQDVAVVSASSPDLHVISARVLKALGRHAELRAGDVRVVSADGRTLRLSASTGYPEKMAEAARELDVDGGETLAQVALQHGRTVTHEEEGQVREYESLAKEHAGLRYVVIPIDFRKRFVGTLALAFDGRRPFREDEIELYHAVAHTLGQAMETARLLDAEKEATRQAAAELEVTNLLLETAERLARPLELAEVLDALADSLSRVTGRSRVYVLLHDPHTGALVVRAVRGAPAEILGKTGPLTRFEEQVRGMAAGGRAQEVRIADMRVAAGERARMEATGVERALVVPIAHRGHYLGAATVDEPGSAEAFSERETRLCENVAALSAVVIENARTYESEHRIAETLQETLLLMPERVAGVTFGTLYRSATATARVGGDFYDVFEAGEGRVALVVGDVSGKGLDAASVTALARNAVRIHASEGLSPGVVMDKTNDVLRRFTSAETFVTAFFGVLQVGSGALTYVCAGHPEGMIVGRGGYVRALGGDSPLLGALDEVTFAERVTMVAPTDTVFLYTDGVTEARRDREFYGFERLASFLGSLPDNDPIALPSVVFSEVMAFASGRLGDDVAMLAVCRERRPPAEG